MNFRAPQILLMMLALAFAMSSSVHAQYYERTRPAGEAVLSVKPKALDDVGITEHLLGELPLDAKFKDETGRDVVLGDYFHHGRPVIVNFAYHSCTSLCTMVVRGLVSSMKNLSWSAGEEFDVLTISFDQHDTPQIAAKKRNEALASYGRPSAAKGWHFLTGTEAEIKRVTNAAGYRFAWDATQNQYAHAAAVLITTADGRMARYLYGLEYAETDMKLGLIEASQGRAISTFDPILRYCYTFNGSKYVLMASRVMKLSGLLTMIILFGALGILWRREFRQSSGGDPGAHGGGSVSGKAATAV